jgi:hypothetical protein
MNQSDAGCIHANDLYNARSLQPVDGSGESLTLAVRWLVKNISIRQFVWALVLEVVSARNHQHK